MAAAPPLPKSFEDAARHHLAVAEELERVCGSAHFRTSKRSCEFLQYIVQVALDGRKDSLKERSIGIDLFGRDTSYEPSSDATVRVRANEVRKRLSSYYASSEARSLRIDLPTGSYVPHFLPISTVDKEAVLAALSVPQLTSQTVHELERPQISSVPTSSSSIPPIQALTLVRPALLALLVCTLLLRHQLENREEYLRFWDRLLSGRSAMVLSLSPQDRISLAPSLYPLVWVAGRYGVDATMQGDSLTGTRPEATSSVHVSYTTPPELVADSRLRWALTEAPNPTLPSLQNRSSLPALSALLDRKLAGNGKSPMPTSVSSAALVTILPEDTAILQVQGTDADAIRRLLEELTVERNFPVGLVESVERLNSRHALQVLLYRNSAGEWRRDIFLGDA